MAHVQAHVDKELLKSIKKDVIDKDTSVNAYVEAALREKYEREQLQKEAGREQSNQTNSNSTEGEKKDG